MFWNLGSSLKVDQIIPVIFVTTSVLSTAVHGVTLDICTHFNSMKVCDRQCFVSNSSSHICTLEYTSKDYHEFLPHHFIALCIKASLKWKHWSTFSKSRFEFWTRMCFTRWYMCNLSDFSYALNDVEEDSVLLSSQVEYAVSTLLLQSRVDIYWSPHKSWSHRAC